MELTTEGFACLTRVLMNIADACCGGKLVMTLEGGYHIAGQMEAVKLVLLEMRDETRRVVDNPFFDDGDDCREDPIIRRVIDQISPYWPVF
jgi:acetoin utilization deacetylase AcuC-like enzyme